MTGMKFGTLMLTVEKNLSQKNRCNVIPIIRSEKYCEKSYLVIHSCVPRTGKAN